MHGMVDFGRFGDERLPKRGADLLEAGAQQNAVDLVSLQMHERAAALDPHVVGEVAKLREIMMLSRIENDPDHDSAALRVVERVERDRVREGVGRKVNRALGGGDESRVDRIEALLGREVNLLR